MSVGGISNSEFVGNLYRDHRGWLLVWLNRNLGCHQRAEDLNQNTLVRLLGRPELPGLREPRAFLAKMTRGLTIDHFHRATLKQAYLAELALAPEVEQPSTGEQYLIFGNLHEIGRLFGVLLLKVRSVFLCSRLDDIPHAETIGRLGVSMPRVRQHLVQGLCQYCTALYGEPR